MKIRIKAEFESKYVLKFSFFVCALILVSQINSSHADSARYSADALREALDSGGIREDPLPKPLFKDGTRCRDGVRSPYIGEAGYKAYKAYTVTHNKYFVPPSDREQQDLDEVATEFMGQRCKSGKCHFNPYGFNGGAWYPDQVCVNGSMKITGRNANVDSGGGLRVELSGIFPFILNMLVIMAVDC